AQQLAQDPYADRQAALPEAVADGLGGQVGPADFGAHGVAGGVVFQDVAEGRFEVGEEVAAAPASTPFFRTRWGRSSGRRPSSSKPRGPALGSWAQGGARYPCPPGPSLAASTAA